MTGERDVCANPRCRHIRIVHPRGGRCESLNAEPRCSCSGFVAPKEEEER